MMYDVCMVEKCNRILTTARISVFKKKNYFKIYTSSPKHWLNKLKDLGV